MPRYRRVRLKGGVFFFTVVTHERRRILTSDLGIRCLRRAWRTTHETMPFETEALCVLPDHIHAMWTLPEGDDDYSARWRKLKGLFTREFRRRGGSEGTGSESRKSKGEAGVWQRRFWEHRIRDADDFRRHVEYIHFNPVKHGYVTRLAEWEWSSFHEHVEQGWLEPDWGTIEPEGIVNLDAGE